MAVAARVRPKLRPSDLTENVHFALSKGELARARALQGRRPWRELFLDLMEAKESGRDASYRDGVMDGSAVARAEATAREQAVTLDAYRDGVLTALVMVRAAEGRPLFAAGQWADALAERLAERRFVEGCRNLGMAFGVRVQEVDGVLGELLGQADESGRRGP